MNFMKLFDFAALKNVNWAKPALETKNAFTWISLGMISLMLLFVFIPWFGAYNDITGDGAYRLGITLWNGILGFLFAGAALVGWLYKQPAIVFWASVTAMLLGFIGMFGYASLTDNGITLSAAEVEVMVEGFRGRIETTHIGAILFFLASLGSSVVACLYAVLPKKAE
jgi:hypothetical protein